jgi:hypothetical protein
MNQTGGRLPGCPVAALISRESATEVAEVMSSLLSEMFNDEYRSRAAQTLRMAMVLSGIRRA